MLSSPTATGCRDTHCQAADTSCLRRQKKVGTVIIQRQQQGADTSCQTQSDHLVFIIRISRRKKHLAIGPPFCVKKDFTSFLAIQHFL